MTCFIKVLDWLTDRILHCCMPAAQCCTNCRTKYSLLNREEGCSLCTLSFCRKCVQHRVLIPRLASTPLTVCRDCHEKAINHPEQLSNQQRRVTVTPLPEPAPDYDKAPQPFVPKPWWGDGLPPPSMRQSVASGPRAPPRVIHHKIKEQAEAQKKKDDAEMKKLEDRHKELKKTENDPPRILEMSEIEERLAALRGCDVEVIRNPRCLVQTSRHEPRPADTVTGLMEIAKSEAALEEQFDPVRIVEERYSNFKKDETGHLDDVENRDVNRISAVPSTSSRMSEISTDTTFSEATQQEMAQIDRLMEDAKKRVNETKEQEKNLDTEMRQVLAATRTKSIDIEKVNDEFGKFWDKQLDKVKVDLSDSEEDDKSLDEETLKKIIKEAEMAPDEPPEKPTSPSQDSERRSSSDQGSPKKKNFFGRLFKKKD